MPSSSANPQQTHGLCEEHGDTASAGLFENRTDEVVRRVWYLFEAIRGRDGHGGVHRKWLDRAFLRCNRIRSF